jgi:hypothetical protein
MVKLEIKENDLIALDALWKATQACNMADTTHLHYQFGGTWGLAKDAFIDAATAIFGSDVAQRLYDMVINNGEDVAYQLNYMRNELCEHCSEFLDEKHCEDMDCRACDGTAHKPECYELECLGHESTDGPMGIAVYCNSACRPLIFTSTT